MPSKQYRIKPTPFTYVLIDGTLAGDSAVFGDLLERKGNGGWTNLLDFLPLATEDTFGKDAGRLNPGPRQPFVPVYQIHTTSGAPLRDRTKSIPVLMPNGFNGQGRDPFWREYSEGEEGDKKVAKEVWPNGRTTFGRHTAIERSNEFVSEFVLNPGVEVIMNPDGTASDGRLLDRAAHKVPDPARKQFYAELLYVSSHGWLGGFSAGDGMLSWPEARPAQAIPGHYPATKYFVVGKVLKELDHFFGPKWIVFALCSAACSATWSFWVRVFERSFPQVRGLLAYEESAPGAGDVVARAFFDRLSAGQTFLEAWKGANKAHPWSAIVHREAEGDTLHNWGQQQELTGPKTDAKGGMYKGYLSSKPNGDPIRVFEAPFEVKLSQELGGKTFEVLPEHLARGRAALAHDRKYQLEIAPGSNQHKGKSIKQATVRFVHVRDTYSPQISYSSIFKPQPEGNGVEVQDDGKAILRLEPVDGSNRLRAVLETKGKQAINTSHVHRDHTYLWLRVGLHFDGEQQPVTHDFTMKGLLY